MKLNSMSLSGLSLAVLGLLAGCNRQEPASAAPDLAPQAQPELAPQSEAAPQPAGPTPADAQVFLGEVERGLRAYRVAADVAAWERDTNITPATIDAAGAAEAQAMKFTAESMAKARQFLNVSVDPLSRRQLDLIRVSTSLPAPADDAAREKLAGIASNMGAFYGAAKACETKGVKEVCQDLGQLDEILATKRNPEVQLHAWEGWHNAFDSMRGDYSQFVSLANEGAREAGFADLGQLWRSQYDMTPEAFEDDVERLWQQVSPLYQQLHCHVRAELSQRYGAKKMGSDGTIPAHLLGNMWAQEWANLYPDLEPYPGQPSIDVTKALQKRKATPVEMVKMAENFFVSLGMDPLPESFWQRSMLEKPKDREVVCHASAWDPHYNDDLRIKMCIRPTMEDLITIHHELGHIYYFHAYYQQPMMFQAGANDGFHEGIGDTLALSVTPAYLKQVGLLKQVADNDKAVINAQMQSALAKIAFLPFGLVIDKWRWQVFSGEVKPENYNASWWELRRKYQGIAPVQERDESHFDPGAKFHIPGNTPYMRYFLARILQFQFHAALCKASGHQGPLHTCSIYGSKEAGNKLQAMLAMGASKPWPEAMEAITGSRTIDAGPMIEYYQPLLAWLAEKNQGRTCGW